MQKHVGAVYLTLVPGGIASRSPDQILPVAAHDRFGAATAEKAEVERCRAAASRGRPLDQPREAIHPFRVDQGRHFLKYEFSHAPDATVISYGPSHERS